MRESQGGHEILTEHLSEKVLHLHEVLERNAIPHAFGGAIALGYHKEPRATADIDLNIFLGRDGHAAVVRHLEELFEVPDRAGLVAELAERGQARVKWGETFIDVFFSDTDFHASMAERAQLVDFLGTLIPVLSAEDLIVCKALYDRRKDWQDIYDLFRTHPTDVDVSYVRGWLSYFLDDDDHRFATLEATIDDVHQELRRGQGP